MFKLTTFLLLLSCTLLYVVSAQYGLISDDGQPLNLLDLRTNAIVEGPYAQVEYIHTYTNPYNIALETKFYFPRTENSVFYKFEATIRNQTTVGHIFEKEQAKQMYEENKAEGNTVAFSERTPTAPDIMKIQVGNIPPQESVEIKYSVIQPLEVIVNKLWGFTLPVVVTERYAPASVDPSEIPDIQNVNLSHSLYDEWKINVTVRAKNPFSYIYNPSHNLKPEIFESVSRLNTTLHEAKWEETLIPNKDFVVYFRQEELDQPYTILAAHPSFPNDYVLLTNFLPELNNLDLGLVQTTLETSEDGLAELKQLELDEDIQNAKGEFIFVIDRSGSMMEGRIANLKRALSKFLEILPRDSLFNIISFGSTYSLYKPESLTYSASSLSEVEQWISTIDADMGGTEILAPLQLVTLIPVVQGYPRTVMVLTDGDVYNSDEIINHVRVNANKMRFFAVGIGYGASEYLIKNLARAGKGTSVFVLDNEDIGEKALYLIKAAVSRYIEDINFKIECFNAEQNLVFFQQENLGMLFKEQPFKKWIYLQGIPGLDLCQVNISYFNSFKNEPYEKELEIADFPSAEITETWHKVAYDAKIKDLDLLVKSAEYAFENADELKARIIDLSTKYQVMSDYTAFLAVILTGAVNPEDGSIEMTIPNLDSADYEEQLENNDNWGGSIASGARPSAVSTADVSIAAVDGGEATTIDDQSEMSGESTSTTVTPSESVEVYCQRDPSVAAQCDGATINPVCASYTENGQENQISVRNECIACQTLQLGAQNQTFIDKYSEGLCSGDQGIRCEYEPSNFLYGQISPVCGLLFEGCTDNSCRQTFAEPSAACHNNGVALYLAGECPGDQGISCEPYRPDALVGAEGQEWWSQVEYNDVCGFNGTNSMAFENHLAACADGSVLYFTQGPCSQ